MAAKRKSRKSGKSNTLATVIITAVVVLALCFFVPRVVHKCDHCGEWFFGTGFAPNALEEKFGEEEVICEKCEEEEYVVLGIRLKDKEEHKIPLIPSSDSKDKSEKE